MKQHENTPIRTYMSCHGTVQLRDSLKFITSITPKIPLYHSAKAPITHVVHAVTHPPSLSHHHHHHHHISQCSQALACFPHTHGASWSPALLLFFLPRLLISIRTDRSVHTSPQHQTHPCCYVRAMQRLTNQIIIATGHTLTEDRGQ